VELRFACTHTHTRTHALPLSPALCFLTARTAGPTLNKMGKFPTVISHSDDIAAKVVQAQMTCKFQLKKVRSRWPLPLALPL
jgi:ribosomal protein L1